MPPDPIRPLVFRHPVSAATHLFWCGWALYATAVLWRLAVTPRQRVGVAVFGGSMVLLYAASGAYHAVPATRPALVQVLLRLDFSAIYVLIAGTATPLFLALPGRRAPAALLATVWGLALAGVAARWLLPAPPFGLALALYLGLGAVAFLPLPALARAIGTRGAAWAVAGGLVYATGAACDALGRPVLWPGVVGPHEVLHFTDMVGSGIHLYVVGRYVVGRR
jgi:hemolysin III